MSFEISAKSGFSDLGNKFPSKEVKALEVGMFGKGDSDFWTKEGNSSEKLGSSGPEFGRCLFRLGDWVTVTGWVTFSIAFNEPFEGANGA